MFNSPPREKEWVSWFWVILWSLIIFITVPYARTLQAFVQKRWDREVFTDIVLMAVVLFVGLCLLWVYRNSRWKPFSRYLWLAGVGGAYTYGTFHLNKNPEEAMHFIEYGVLGVLLFRALSHRIRDPTIYFSAAMIGCMVGMADETIQWITPRRFFDYRDIWLNAFSGLLVQIAIDRGLRPRHIKSPIRPFSIQILCRLAAALLVFFGFCFSNTPARIEWLVSKIPSLNYLLEGDTAMSEYGHRIEDPEIGLFYSRFSGRELIEIDRRLGRSSAKILNHFRRNEDYPKFLKIYTPIKDPFTHEARVHLFRRDHYLGVAPKHSADAKMYMYHLTVAYRENQIMQKYFGETLKHSQYGLNPRVLEMMEKMVDRHIVYESEVSANLLTRFGEKRAWIVILFSLVALTLIHRNFGKMRRVEPLPQAGVVG